MAQYPFSIPAEVAELKYFFKPTLWSNGRDVQNLLAKFTIHNNPESRWDKEHRQWVDLLVDSSIHSEWLTDKKAVALYEAIMAIAREQGFPGGVGTRLILYGKLTARGWKTGKTDERGKEEIAALVQLANITVEPDPSYFAQAGDTEMAEPDLDLLNF